MVWSRPFSRLVVLGLGSANSGQVSKRLASITCLVSGSALTRCVSVSPATSIAVETFLLVSALFDFVNLYWVVSAALRQ